MDQKFIAANWKMHKTFREGLQLAEEVVSYLKNNPISNNQVILFPSFIHLEAISQLLSSEIDLYLGAQNCHYEPAGPFTGEISAPMLAAIRGVKYVLVGHSERRQNFFENNHLIAKKIDAILNCGLSPVFCCGETLAIREKNQHYGFVRQQLIESLFHLHAAQLLQLKIAYEPIWAIGTGVTPHSLEIEDMQQEIRDILAKQYDVQVADKVSILYGGSCNAKNVSTFINLSGIDGVLIGGASLHLKEFIDILNSLRDN